MARVSKSRNVCGYVKAVLKARKLAAAYQTKLELLEPLRRAADIADTDATTRWWSLTGGQQAEYRRILNNISQEG